MIIDSHHHFWRFTTEEFGWIPDEMGTIRRDYLPSDLAPVLKEHGVKGVVTVQARQSDEETTWLLAMAEANAFVEGVVGWLPIASPQFAQRLDRHAHPKLVGLRHVVQGEPDGFLARADFNRGISLLTKRRLVYDILVLARQLPEVIAFVDRHPEQVFVVDHLAKPENGRRLLEPWRSQMRELGKRANVHCKLSGGITEADLAWTHDSVVPYFDWVLEAFGAERLIFGSNWPVVEAGPSGGFGVWLRAVQRWAGKLTPGEQARLFAGNATSVYRLGRA